jgi:HSP20 family protein
LGLQPRVARQSDGHKDATGFDEGEEMAMTRRSGTEIDWPDWFFGRRLEWPSALRDLIEGDEASMRIEEYEEDGSLVVRAEAPGLDPERDVEITVSNQVLLIKAQRRQESKSESKGGFRSEFRYGSFTRSVPLPAGATDKDVKASYVDGILEVRVPIDDRAASGRKIPISRQ